MQHFPYHDPYYIPNVLLVYNRQPTKVNFIISAFIAGAFFYCQVSPFFGKHFFIYLATFSSSFLLHIAKVPVTYLLISF